MTIKQTIKNNIRKYLQHWCHEFYHWNIGDERSDHVKKMDRVQHLELYKKHK